MIPVNITTSIEGYADSHYESFKAHIGPDKLKKMNRELTRLFIEYPFTECQPDIKEIILAKPELLKKIAEKFNIPFPIAKYKTISSIADLYENQFRPYDKYLDSRKSRYNAHIWLNRLGIKTCLYCNRNYTTNFTSLDPTTNKNVGYTTCQVDHFYPKSSLPFLALSFYNLIPSCAYCNLSKHHFLVEWNPYQEKPVKVDDLYSFSLLQKKNGTHLDQVEIRFTPLDKKIDVMNRQMLFDDQYKNHEDYANELYYFIQKTPKSYINELQKKLGNIPITDVYRILYQNYMNDEELHKRPLSKLTRDILKQFGRA